jgi:hypothetical protein
MTNLHSSFNAVERLLSWQVPVLEDAIRQRPAFLMHEAAAAALAAIDGPELRRSAAALVAIAYCQVRAAQTVDSRGRVYSLSTRTI